ncbi:unnamed protein product [Mesocestoides corti]|uniref:Phosphatidylinositol-glycan biosynthesis class W protein n=1 Tax=Mesocestoides corti TaxID=53468 RepID=A0A0R3UFZ6_MESCO|nr:unnamed protein product [Mesocestoides corti]
MDAVRAEKHRQFVSGHTGGSAIEILGLFSAALAIGYVRLFFHGTSETVSIALDLLCTVVAFALPCTLLADYTLELVILTCSTACLVYLKLPSLRHCPTFHNAFSVWRRLLRAVVLFYTCVCIYAVDFPIFPRRFAKTETFGISLMDTGVGLIAIATGMSNVAFINDCRNRQSSLLKVIVKSTIPSLLLGAIRTLTVKTLGYPEHVSEYGIHWNFFITLALVRLGGFLCGYVVSGQSDFDAMNNTLVLALLAVCLHHFGLLVGLGWASRITNEISPADRESSLVLANAEGLLSLLGYLSLFLFGTVLSYFVHIHTDPNNRGSKVKFVCVQGKRTWIGETRKVATAVLGISALAFLVVALYGAGSVSRRLVNLPYIALQIGLMTFVMGVTLLWVFHNQPGEYKVTNKKDLFSLVTIVSDNSFAYFLISNVVTGLLNMFIDTLVIAELQPAWFSTACQFLLLTAYVVVCPLITRTLSFLPLSPMRVKG